MQLYQIQEADIVLPFEVQDLSVNAFAYTVPDPLSFSSVASNKDVPPEFSLVISRDVVNTEETVSHFANQQLQILKRNLKGYNLLERTDVFVDGVTAIVAEFKWASEQEIMRQKQAYILCPTFLRTPTRTGRLALTLTATSHDNVYEKYSLILEQVLYSFTFRR